LAGLVFSLGLILVIVGGAELFTGNTLIIMAWDGDRVSTRQVMRNWGIVYTGNFVGSLGTVALVFLSGQYAFGDGAVGATALATANAKVGLGFTQAVALGILCNALVCLAVWLSLSARTTTDKILAIVPPIAAFVAAGFEHSVANMTLFAVALFIPHSPAVSWAGFAGNLVPVTIGNIIGGAVFVGAAYWYVGNGRAQAGSH
ncbi:MAG: formate/nitrite transporter family protein, partial [Spirochaetota bacterium]